jgi:hypothetical protein
LWQIIADMDINHIILSDILKVVEYEEFSNSLFILKTFSLIYFILLIMVKIKENYIGY